MADQKPDTTDPLHWHEAMDRTFICMKMVDNLLLAHPVFEHNTALKQKAEEARQHLFALCQEIGKCSLDA